MEWLAEVSETEPFGVKTTEAPQYRRVAMQRQADGDDADDGAGGPGAGIERRTGIVAGDGFAFVSHTGEVFPSGFLPESAGNVRDRSITELYRDSSLFQSLRDRDQLSGKCGACPYRHVCGGSRSRAFAHTGDPLASDPLCPFVPEGTTGRSPGTTPTARRAASRAGSERSLFERSIFVTPMDRTAVAAVAGTVDARRPPPNTFAVGLGPYLQYRDRVTRGRPVYRPCRRYRLPR